MKITPKFRIALSILLLLLMAYFDTKISAQVNTSFLYFLPILVFSYQRKIKEQYIIVFCIFAACLWGVVDYQMHEYTYQMYFFINLLTRIFFFILVAIYESRLTKAIEQRRIITTQKAGLVDAKKELELSNDQLNKFIGMAAHDIRNPVGNIQMISEIILEDEKSISEESTNMLKMIQSSSINALQILKDTLSISQIQSGIIDLNLTKSNYIDFIKESISFNEQLAKRKAQTILFESSIESIDFSFDKNRMSQVVNNLLTNAIKYSDFNKEIKVKISYASKNKNDILTEVIDHGMGIDQQFHDKIFEPFIMTSNIPTDNESKSGLGLTIVKKIIDLHNGTIAFTSTKGQGSNFYYTLPIRSM